MTRVKNKSMFHCHCKRYGQHKIFHVLCEYIMPCNYKVKMVYSILLINCIIYMWEIPGDLQGINNEKMPFQHQKILKTMKRATMIINWANVVHSYNGKPIKMPPVFILLIELVNPQDLLLIRKFVRGTKDSKCKIVNGRVFEQAANLWP